MRKGASPAYPDEALLMEPSLRKRMSLTKGMLFLGHCQRDVCLDVLFADNPTLPDPSALEGFVAPYWRKQHI